MNRFDMYYAHIGTCINVFQAKCQPIFVLTFLSMRLVSVTTVYKQTQKTQQYDTISAVHLLGMLLLANVLRNPLNPRKCKPAAPNEAPDCWSRASEVISQQCTFQLLCFIRLPTSAYLLDVWVTLHPPISGQIK